MDESVFHGNAPSSRVGGMPAATGRGWRRAGASAVSRLRRLRSGIAWRPHKDLNLNHSYLQPFFSLLLNRRIERGSPRIPDRTPPARKPGGQSRRSIERATRSDLVSAANEERPCGCVERLPVRLRHGVHSIQFSGSGALNPSMPELRRTRRRCPKAFRPRHSPLRPSPRPRRPSRRSE